LTAFTKRGHNTAVQCEIVLGKEIRDSPEVIIELNILDISTIAIFQNDPEEINMWMRKTMTMSLLFSKFTLNSYQRSPSGHEQNTFGPDKTGFQI
jgi:hypothetical protein